MTRLALEELHIDRFIENVNSEFQVLDNPGVEFALWLVEVNERAIYPRQEAFSLIFRGPAQYFMPQGIHKLKHPDLGEIDLFLVPVGHDGQGFQYEAVFNRLIKPAGAV